MAVLFVWTASPSPSLARECPPAAFLQGEPALSARLADLLKSRGVATTAAEGCPAVLARLAVAGDQIEIDVTDPWGRQEVRRVSDPATAATVIESWCRSDLVSSLLDGPGDPRPANAPGPARPEPAPGVDDSDRPPSSPRYVVGLHPGVSYQGDGSVWMDVAVTGCAVWGPLCVGGLLRGGGDLGETGDSARYDSQRAGMDALATIEYPVDLKRVSLTPGLAFGGGWVRIRGPRDARGAVDVDTGYMRIEGSLRAGIPLSRRFAFAVGVSAGVSPLAHRSAFVEDNVSVAGVPLWGVRGTLGFEYKGW